MGKWKSTKNHWSNKSETEKYRDMLKKMSVGWGKKPKTGKWITCPICGKKVWKKLCFFKRSRELFCSHRCLSVSKKGKIPKNFEMFRAKSPFRVGDKNINWKGGISPYPREWKLFIKHDVWTRDRSTCQMCGRAGIEGDDFMCVHHKDFNKRNYDLGNLILLCRSCHNKVHWVERKRLKTIL